jgi:hypothetical protein
MRDAPLITHLRPRAAAAPSPARPRPPANRGFSNNESRETKERGGGGFDIVQVVGGFRLGLELRTFGSEIFQRA